MKDGKSNISQEVQIQTSHNTTITIDNIFLKNTKNKIFYIYPEKDAEILSYINKNKNLYVFAEDKIKKSSGKLTKQFMATSYVIKIII
jgi:hypothetical protein